MKHDTPDIALGKKERFAAWNRFWFTPANPTLLGLMRICCGLITFYTMFIYSFKLQEFMGEHAWYDLETRLKEVRDTPRQVDGPLNPRFTVVEPKTEEERLYNVDYQRRWGSWPPLPFPETKSGREFTHWYRDTYKFDLRINGLRTPENDREKAYLIRYSDTHKTPPPAYPKDAEDEAWVEEYIRVYGVDPRLMYHTGSPSWSLWFDLTDPTGMAIVHGIVVLVTFLFTIGFCTRITSALTWMFCIWYIHRSPVVLFGVDTMQTILLLYLMIGPSGAALSVDRLIARWWSKNKLSVINRWRGLWGKPLLSAEQIVPAAYSPNPVPSVSANVAYRLIQIHLCIIYLIAGLAKLQGTTWWTGTAVWGTLANFEFAPMQFESYMWMLRQLAEVRFVFYLFLTIAGLFTLTFEISYAFLVWRPATRWYILFGAIMLHGFIGLFMGLKTFSLMMLVLNMAFLKDSEVNWFLKFFGAEQKPEPKPGKVPPPAGDSTPLELQTAPVSASTAATAIKEGVGTKVKRK